MSAGPLPISEDLAERLRAEGRSSGQDPAALAASLLDEGLKVRRHPGIVYMDGTAGRRACLSGGPDVWQIIRALRTVPAREFDPVATVCIESDLNARQVKLAVQFYESYPDEIDEMIAKDAATVGLIEEMIAERERTAGLAQSERSRSTRAKSRGNRSAPSL